MNPCKDLAKKILGSTFQSFPFPSPFNEEKKAGNHPPAFPQGKDGALRQMSQLLQGFLDTQEGRANLLAFLLS